MNAHFPADLLSYDRAIIAFSGGKDSIACFLSLLEAGFPLERVELWHHDVDGREEGEDFMDWPCTPAYCRAFAKACGVPIYFSWREGGFLREMMRNQTETSQTHFETPGQLETAGGNSGKLGTRLMFPQVSANLSVRWCSAYLKIDVATIAIKNQTRFNNSRTLVISGERAQESAARAKYAKFEPDRADAREGRLNRHVDRLRPIHQWTEHDVWEILARWGVNAHPAYRIGWGRLSCALCIFGLPNQWASAKAIFPDRINRVASLEVQFGKTIDRTLGVLEKASQGNAYAGCSNVDLVAEANNKDWNGQIFMDSSNWETPAGAFSVCSGPQ